MGVGIGKGLHGAKSCEIKSAASRTRAGHGEGVVDPGGDRLVKSGRWAGGVCVWGEGTELGGGSGNACVTG